jgi:hypothetical protein
VPLGRRESILLVSTGRENEVVVAWEDPFPAANHFLMIMSRQRITMSSVSGTKLKSTLLIVAKSPQLFAMDLD